jgi:hypothetical protein
MHCLLTDNYRGDKHHDLTSITVKENQECYVTLFISRIISDRDRDIWTFALHFSTQPHQHHDDGHQPTQDQNKEEDVLRR